MSIILEPTIGVCVCLPCDPHGFLRRVSVCVCVRESHPHNRKRFITPPFPALTTVCVPACIGLSMCMCVCACVHVPPLFLVLSFSNASLSEQSCPLGAHLQPVTMQQKKLASVLSEFFSNLTNFGGTPYNISVGYTLHVSSPSRMHYDGTALSEITLILEMMKL